MTQSHASSPWNPGCGREAEACRRGRAGTGLRAASDPGVALEQLRTTWTPAVSTLLPARATHPSAKVGSSCQRLAVLCRLGTSYSLLGQGGGCQTREGGWEEGRSAPCGRTLCPAVPPPHVLCPLFTQSANIPGAGVPRACREGLRDEGQMRQAWPQGAYGDTGRALPPPPPGRPPLHGPGPLRPGSPQAQTCPPA